MWCKECQQDVPGVAAAEEGKYACPRCGLELNVSACRASHSGPAKQACAGPAESSAPADEPIVTITPEPPPISDTWELEEQLRHIERVLAVNKLDGKRTAAKGAAKGTSRRIRVDAAHAERPKRHARVRRKTRPRRHLPREGATSWLPFLTWSLLSLGSMALACGGVLVGWSMATGRDDLWSIGTPIVLVGQLVLLMGFILQLDRLWQHSRDASAKLDHVDRRLDELNTTTSLLGTSHSSPAVSFYSHMAAGANPQLLLSDLKGQLDLLATKISQTER